MWVNVKTFVINLKDKFFNEKCRRKNIENLVIFLVGVVIVIITGSYIFKDDEEVIQVGNMSDVFETHVENIEKLLAIF